jgi:hypothetical protein
VWEKAAAVHHQSQNQKTKKPSISESLCFVGGLCYMKEFYKLMVFWFFGFLVLVFSCFFSARRLSSNALMGQAPDKLVLQESWLG